MILSTRSWINARQLSKSQDSCPIQNEYNDQAIEDDDRTALSDTNHRGCGNTCPAIADIPSSADDCKGTDVSPSLFLETECGQSNDFTFPFLRRDNLVVLLALRTNSGAGQCSQKNIPFSIKHEGLVSYSEHIKIVYFTHLYQRPFCRLHGPE